MAKRTSLQHLATTLPIDYEMRPDSRSSRNIHSTEFYMHRCQHWNYTCILAKTHTNFEPGPHLTYLRSAMFCNTPLLPVSSNAHQTSGENAPPLTIQKRNTETPTTGRHRSTNPKLSRKKKDEGKEGTDAWGNVKLNPSAHFLLLCLSQ